MMLLAVPQFLILKKTQTWAGGVLQAMEHPPRKYQALSSNLIGAWGEWGLKHADSFV
jgi:hypothetical protein